MSWKDSRAIETIYKAFKRSKDKIWQSDIDALKHLNEVNDIKAEQAVANNVLFAKLVCVMLRANLHQCGNMKMAIKHIDGVLKQPLEVHINNLRLSLNGIEATEYFKTLGFDMDSLDDQDQLLKRHQQELLKKVQESWTQHKVKKAFHNTTNDFIKDIDNYV